MLVKELLKDINKLDGTITVNIMKDGEKIESYKKAYILEALRHDVVPHGNEELTSWSLISHSKPKSEATVFIHI